MPPVENVVEGQECGKVTAAQPCPFLQEGAQVTVNADAEIPAGSFMTFVSALSVISVEAQITGQQAIAAVLVLQARFTPSLPAARSTITSWRRMRLLLARLLLRVSF
jgi:hypothetical protein